MSQTEELLIIYETEAKQWATYLQSVFTGPVAEDGICCYDLTSVSNRSDFSRLSCYRCKLLILSEGMLEGLCQLRRSFLSRVLSPSDRVVVLLCGVDSLTPLLNLVPLNADEWLQISSEQDAPDYLSSVVSIIKKGALATAVNVNDLTCKPSGQEQKAKQMQSSGADRVRTNVMVVPSRVPCGSSMEVFVLLKNKAADSDCEVEFSDENQNVRVKPARWNELVLRVSAPDFPAGNVRVTVYSGGKSPRSTQLQYYTNTEEVNRLLTYVADPVQFMCEALQVSSVDKLDQKLSSMLLEAMPTGGFQGLQCENTCGRELHHTDTPSLLHFAARYGLRCVAGLLLQCPGAERALHTACPHSHTPAEVAKSHGHMELHVLLKEAMKMFSSGEDGSVYEIMCNAGANKQQQQGEDEEGEEDDLYTQLGEKDGSNPDQNSAEAQVIANRPPAPTPRPECMNAKPCKTPYIVQVFQKKKTSKMAPDASSFFSNQGHKQESSATYDTFVPKRTPGIEPLTELQQRGKTGSVSVDEATDHFRSRQQVQNDVDDKKEEQQSPPRANMVNNSDDGVYDKINNAHQAPMNRRQRGNQQADSEFYSKAHRGQQIFRKADKS